MISLRLLLLLLVSLQAGCGGSDDDDAGDGDADADADADADGDADADADGDADADADADVLDYARLFPSDRIVDIDLDIAQDDWAAMMADPMQDIWVPATLTYDGVVVPDVAVRLKGNSSRNSVSRTGSERYSFKVDTDRIVSGQRILGVDRFNLNNGFKDPSYLRERLAADLYATFGLPTVRTAHARLTMGSEPFGLYTVVEEADKDFLREHFPDEDGAYYKPEPPAGNLEWLGDQFAPYEASGMDVESDPDTTDHAPLLHFLDVLNNTPDDELVTALPEVFDVDGWLRYLAVTIALVNLDYYGAMGHNYLLYEDRTTGRFVFIPWDLNEAYGNFQCGGMTPDDLLSFPYDDPTCSLGPRAAPHPLITRVLGQPAWLAALEANLTELLDGPWDPDLVHEQVHAMADLVREDVRTDPTAFRSFADFEANLDDDLLGGGGGPGQGSVFGLTSFAERRTAALRALLP